MDTFWEMLFEKYTSELYIRQGTSMHNRNYVK